MWGTWVSSCMSILVKSILKCWAASLDWWLEGWMFSPPTRHWCMGHITLRSSMVLLCMEKWYWIVYSTHQYIAPTGVSSFMMRDALFLYIQNLALGPTQGTHQGWGMCSKGVEELAFFKSFPDSEGRNTNASIPYHAFKNPKIFPKFHNLGTSCKTLIWLGPAGSILGALKAIVNVIGMTKMTPPIKETGDDWDWMP